MRRRDGTMLPASAPAYTDGPRVLLGGDGNSLAGDPSDWEGGQQVCDAIDQRVPPSSVERVGSPGTATVWLSSAALVLWTAVAVVSIGGAVTGTFPEPPTNGVRDPFRIAWLAILAAPAAWAHGRCGGVATTE